MRVLRLAPFVALTLTLLDCATGEEVGDTSEPNGAGELPDGAIPDDATARSDGATKPDSSRPVDSGNSDGSDNADDAATPNDAAIADDAETPNDAAIPADDAETPNDAATVDAGSDSGGVDAGDDAHVDAGSDATVPVDAGNDAAVPVDAGNDAAVAVDAGNDAAFPVDAGSDAAVPVDAGSDSGAGSQCNVDPYSDVSVHAGDVVTATFSWTGAPQSRQIYLPSDTTCPVKGTGATKRQYIAVVVQNIGTTPISLEAWAVCAANEGSYLAFYLGSQIPSDLGLEDCASYVATGSPLAAPVADRGGGSSCPGLLKGAGGIRLEGCASAVVYLQSSGDPSPTSMRIRAGSP